MLEVNNLTKFHGDVPALRGVQFTLARGEVLALLGHNGAGKTTLLHLLALLTSPSSGSIRIAGANMDGQARLAAKASIGLLGHQSFLYDELTARENLAFFARLYGLADAAIPGIVEKRLEHVALVEAGDELVRHYSRGMRQRLALARAFLHEPELVLLDEPFTGLDQASSRVLRDEIAASRTAGRTVVMSSHDVPLAQDLSTKVLVLERGRVIYFGAPEKNAQSTN